MNFRLNLNLLLLAFSVSNTTAKLQATEIDNFTPYTIKLEDSTDKLNEVTNQKLELAMNRANRTGRYACNEKVLRSQIWKLLGGDFWGKLENYIVSGPFDKHSPTRRGSIYGNFRVTESFPMYMVKLGATIRIGDVIVGADKFGHFFAEGHQYHKLVNLQGRGENAGFDYGEKTERGFYGLATTGVYSYGDLTANYNGWTFWQRLTEGENPFFACQDLQWVRKAKFDWREYVDAAWDESINCSKFRGERLENRITSRVKWIEDRHFEKTKEKINLACPRRPDLCHEMVKKYGENSERLIHPLCREAAATYEENLKNKT